MKTRTGTKIIYLYLIPDNLSPGEEGWAPREFILEGDPSDFTSETLTLEGADLDEDTGIKLGIGRNYLIDTNDDQTSRYVKLKAWRILRAFAAQSDVIKLCFEDLALPVKLV